jgi:hypothetical protein
MIFTLILAAIMIGVSAAVVSAQTGGCTLDWFSIDNGGGQSIGRAYTLNGVIGQPGAGLLTGGAYTLQGGFLQAVDYRVYLPVVLR